MTLTSAQLNASHKLHFDELQTNTKYLTGKGASIVITAEKDQSQVNLYLPGEDKPVYNVTIKDPSKGADANGHTTDKSIAEKRDLESASRELAKLVQSGVYGPGTPLEGEQKPLPEYLTQAQHAGAALVSAEAAGLKK